MEPRLKTSTQWSPFPEELCQLAISALKERFEEEYGLEKDHFVVQGRIYREEIVGLYGLQVDGQLKQHNFEISLEFDPEKEKALELIQNSMDVVEHLWTEFLEDDMDDSDLSQKWQPMEHQKKTWHHRYSTINTSLEEEADRLLEEYEKKLVYQDLGFKDPIDEAPPGVVEDADPETLH